MCLIDTLAQVTDFTADMPFTHANAKEYHAKSLISRKANIERRSIEQEHYEQAVKLLPEYKARRLIRVRKQLDMVDELLENTKDSKILKELADAQLKLSEQERLLDNRPLPGSMRPSPAPTRRQSQAYTAPMIEDDVAPQPAPEAPAKPQPYLGPETG